MDLKHLLSENGIDATKSQILVMRHHPKEAGLRKALPWLAAEHPKVFNAFQQAQYPSTEKKLAQADYLASFIGHKANEALFSGLYNVKGKQPISYKQYWDVPENQTLKNLGMTGWRNPKVPSSALWFDLELTDVLAEWKGKLIVSWPLPARRWARWANEAIFSVRAILEESSLDKLMPPWDEIVLTCAELVHLPKSWVEKLSGWRGVYLIFDTKDGKGYVGSAYGAENLYGRWKANAASEYGVTKSLHKYNTENFLFSILELVSPTMKPEDVIQLESNWKRRLHTREFGLNVN